MLADAEYFSSRLSKLEGSGDLGPHIVGIVNQKAVVDHGLTDEASKEGEAVSEEANSVSDAVESKETAP